MILLGVSWHTPAIGKLLLLPVYVMMVDAVLLVLKSPLWLWLIFVPVLRCCSLLLGSAARKLATLPGLTLGQLPWLALDFTSFGFLGGNWSKLHFRLPPHNYSNPSHYSLTLYHFPPLLMSSSWELIGSSWPHQLKNNCLNSHHHFHDLLQMLEHPWANEHTSKQYSAVTLRFAAELDDLLLLLLQMMIKPGRNLNNINWSTLSMFFTTISHVLSIYLIYIS
jgi:hypothetical protein